MEGWNYGRIRVTSI